VFSTAGTAWRSSSASGIIYSNACIGAISTPIAATPGTVPKLSAPEQEVFDSSGNAYIADTGNHCIRKITASTGFISTFAGICTSSGSTDNVAATSGKFNTPEAVAVDRSGNVYVADTNNATIRMIAVSDGTIHVIAGIQGSAGTTDNTTGNLAKFDHPAGIVVASNGNLFVSDRSNDVIRKISCNSSCPSTSAANWSVAKVAGQFGATADTGVGNPAASFNLNAPEELAIDDSDNIYIADKGHNKVRKLTSCSTTCVSAEFAGSGSSGHVDHATATSGQLNTPTGLALDTTSSPNALYIADSGTKYVRKVAITGTNALSTVAGTGSAGYSGDGYGVSVSLLSAAHGVAYYGGTVYIVDTGNNLIRRIASEGSDPIENVILAVAGDTHGAAAGYAGDGAAAWGGAGLVNPSGMAVDSSGNVFIADLGDNRIREIVASTGDITTVAGTGSAGTNGDGGDARTAKVNQPEGVALDSSGNLYIADSTNLAIRKVSNPNASNATMTTVAGVLGSQCAGVGVCGDGGAAASAKFMAVGDITIDASNNIYVTDVSNNRIRKFTVGGNITDYAGSSAGTAGTADHATTATSATFTGPRGIFVDGSGIIYVTDNARTSRRIQANGGAVLTIAGSSLGFSDNATGTSAQFSSPYDLWVDGTSIYVADWGNSRLRKVSTSAPYAVTTLAGTGTSTSTGDNGPALAATVKNIRGVTALSGGNIFAADYTAANIRKIIGPL